MTQRIYLIGTGAIAGHHAQARRALPNTPKLYAADPSPSAREKFAKEFPEAELFKSSDAMLAHAPAEALDIVCVATPPLFHKAEAIKALHSGRHVLCEKPFAISLAEAEEMIAVAQETGKHIACCSCRFTGWSLNRKVSELIEDGSLGQISRVDFIQREAMSRSGIDYQPSSRWFLDASKNGGGCLMDWGVYDLSTLVSIFKPAGVVIADAVCAQAELPNDLPEGVVFDVETEAAAVLRFELQDGTKIQVRYERSSGSHAEATSQARIIAAQGSLEWDWLPFGDELKATLRKTKSKTEADLQTYAPTPYPQGDSWLEAPLRELDRFIRGDAEAKAIIDEQILNAFALVQGIYKVAENGEPITLKMK